MYMSQQSQRPAVIQKFYEHFKTAGIADAATFEELYSHVDRVEIKSANEIVNSLLVCKPAVGSVHFLVSALNEPSAILVNQADMSKLQLLFLLPNLNCKC